MHHFVHVCAEMFVSFNYLKISGTLCLLELTVQVTKERKVEGRMSYMEI